MSGFIAFLSDFGLKDGFVGTVKGVIASINPMATVIDISHNVSSFDILEGALILKASYKYFPKKMIFLCVVDPGVGTDRKAIIVETKNYYFVAPDNGLISLALEEEEVKNIIQITNEEFFLKRDNETFHGRDIFAPVAAHLSKGESIFSFGNKIESYHKINFPKPQKKNNTIKGEIIKFDKFGNAITNITDLGNYTQITINNHKIEKVCKNFLEGEKNKPNLIKGSFGYYEIFAPQASIKDLLNLKKGDRIKIKQKE